MLKKRVIIPSQNPWRSPMVVIPKSNGSLRICVDFRGLKAVARFEAFPIPHVEELLERIGQAKYISILDCSKGYWQIPVVGKDQ